MENNKDISHVYSDTVEFINCIMEDYGFYGDIYKMLKNGDAELALKRKQLFKKIDETWILAIESSLIALDNRVRNPSRDMQEKEAVMPIELSRNITARSVRHLAQHTDYIASIDGDKITPSKILNVWRDETLETYENKFVNTLIDRLFAFVQKRYAKLNEYGRDENTIQMTFSGKFETDKSETKINFDIAVTDKNGDDSGSVMGVDSSSNLWERTEKIRTILLGYLNSDFVKSLNGKMVHPPIMRTNAIMKNKDLHQLLELWQFIESYDKIGYEIVINETAENPDNDYIDELYSLLALQYVMFEQGTKGELQEEKVLARSSTDAPLKPKIITDFKEYDVEDYNVYDVQQKKVIPVSAAGRSRKRLTEEEMRVREAIETALASDREVKARIIAEEKEKERLKLLAEQEKEKLKRRLEREKERKKQHNKKAKMRKKKQSRADKEKES